jgi:S-adenosylmethionine hydrolase
MYIGTQVRMSVISLTTDFGLADWFVGSMKAVILDICPEASVVDLTHAAPPGDIRAGAFALWAGYSVFARGAIHVAVVDPGVGSDRPAIAVRTDRHTFIGPDNGVLSFAIAREQVREIRRLENDLYFRKPVSQTFHGRDVFAPVAAHLARGVQLSSVGRAVSGHVRLAWPEPKRLAGAWEGEILYVDRFGNAITNLTAQHLAALGRPEPRVHVRGHELCGVKRFYQQTAAGQPLAVVGSTGLLEIAIHAGHAAEALGLKPGQPIEVR